MGLAVHYNTLLGSEKNKIEEYANRLAQEVENVASELYLINNFSNSTTLKFQQWYKAASEFLRTRDQRNLISAKYGYAVEEYVNLKIASGTPSVPRDYKVKLQVTHGNTRPDIVILKCNGKEIAWLDITNQSSFGHIFNKAGNWQDGRNFIAELLYPDFDASQISNGSGTIASRAAANSIVRQASVHEMRLIRYMAQKMNLVFCELVGRIRSSEYIDLPDVAECIERKFNVFFIDNYKHPIIKSMLKLYVNCGNANYRIDASNCLNILYKETHQDKFAAMSYIEESFNISSTYICY